MAIGATTSPVNQPAPTSTGIGDVSGAINDINAGADGSIKMSQAQSAANRRVANALAAANASDQVSEMIKTMSKRGFDMVKGA
jgi:hypothetical protein